MAMQIKNTTMVLFILLESEIKIKNKNKKDYLLKN
jgi:hypothetical protein